MSFPADQHYFRGQGRLYLGDRDGVGDVTKLRFLGNVPKLVIETPQSYDSHTESYTGRRYVDLRVLSETRINVSLILENISYENWVFATKGMFAAKPSASVSDELHLADGGYIALDYKTTAAITSVTSPDGLILYEEGVDYEIAPPSSLIYVIPNSDLAGQPFHVNYLAGDAETIAAIVDHERQYYLYFDGLNTVNRRSRVTVEIFKIQFPIASQLDIISDKFLSLQLDGVALYDVTRESDGGFFRVTRETPYLLIADKELVTGGDTFIVSFYGEAPTDYVITGVESADIGGAPLTGTFTASGEQLTFTATVTGEKRFTISLDNGKASVGVKILFVPTPITQSVNIGLGGVPVGEYPQTITASAEVQSQISLGFVASAYLTFGSWDDGFRLPETGYEVTVIGSQAFSPALFMGAGSSIEIVIINTIQGNSGFDGTIRWEFS